LTQFKAHFSAAHRQQKQMQGETAAASEYHAANAHVGQNEDQMAEVIIGALANLTTSTAADRGVVATLTLAKQLEDNSNDLWELKILVKKEWTEKRGQLTFNPSPNNYCWTHG
jgi:purine nucleoside permease